MFLKLIRWIRGYLLININTSMHNSPERFINMCNHNNIYIWNLQNISGNYQFELLLKIIKDLSLLRGKHTPYHI